MNMDFHVFDTYVKAKDGHTMHFDIVTDKSNTERAISFAKEWLKSIGEESAKVTTEECKFCHTHQCLTNHHLKQSHQDLRYP